MIIKGIPSVLILNRTTLPQLRLVQAALIVLERTTKILWDKAQEEADCTDQINPDIDNLYSAIQNILTDLEGLDSL